jgi:hypothetical protein
MSWPDGAVTRDVVEDILVAPTHWHIDWCEGARVPSSEGFGTTLPDGVVERIPTLAKQRKMARGGGTSTTWMFAFIEDRDGRQVLRLQEGPV